MRLINSTPQSAQIDRHIPHLKVTLVAATGARAWFFCVIYVSNK
jgi:hypothetical protein